MKLTKGVMKANVLPCVRAKTDDDLPTMRWEDLQVYLRIMIDGGISIPITKSLLNDFEIEFDELMDVAMINLENSIQIRALGDVLHELTGDPCMEHDDVPILMATTKYESYGAGAVLLLNRFLKDKWIIPCSIHEVLAVDKQSIDRHMLTAMIQDINQSILDDDDILSDHPYDLDKMKGVA